MKTVTNKDIERKVYEEFKNDASTKEGMLIDALDYYELEMREYIELAISLTKEYYLNLLKNNYIKKRAEKDGFIILDANAQIIKQKEVKK